MKRKTLSLLLVIISTTLTAQNDSLISAINWWHSLEKYYDISNRVNPASEKVSIRHKYLNNQIGANCADISHIAPMEQGEQQNTYGLNINGYQKIDSAVVWGSARYEYASINGVRWNNNADFDLLYPYIIADSIGGNRLQESYFISGGFQKRIKHYTIGIEADYRALIRYAKTDPRPLNTVSDFNVNLGLVWHRDTYNIGASVGYGNYHQQLKIKMFGERETTYIYFLRGFGLHQKRLSGNASYHENNYLGQLWHSNVYVRPWQTGFVAFFDYGYETMVHKESNANHAIEPFQLTNSMMTSSLGYRWLSEYSVLEGNLRLRRNKRIGTETIYSFTGNDYESVSESTPYNRTETNVGINLLWTKRNKKGHNQLEIFGALDYNTMDAFHLNDGDRRLFTLINSFSPKLHAKWHLYSGASQWTINHLLQTQIVQSSEAFLNEGMHNESHKLLTHSVQENYWRMSQNIYRTNLSLRYMYHFVSKKSLGVETKMELIGNGTTMNNAASIHVSLNF